MRDDDGDRTARARIRDAAVGTFGTAGFDAPVRAVAAAAGVSPGLVIHHFGSKEGLRVACDEHVLRVIREAETESVVRSSPGALLAQLAELDEYGPLVGYLLQALLAGGDLAATLLARLTEDAEGHLAEAVAAGRMRPSRDPAARAAYLVDIGIGAVLTFVRRHPAVGGDHRALLRAYAEANSLPALELYTEGLLTDSGLLQEYLQYRAGRADPARTSDPGSPCMTTAPAVELRGLSKSFGTTRALDGLDLTVAAGSVTGFLGPNGAGKSTTLRVLLGLLHADGGTVRLLGGYPWDDAVALHRRLAYVPGDVTLWPSSRWSA